MEFVSGRCSTLIWRADTSLSRPRPSLLNTQHTGTLILPHGVVDGTTLHSLLLRVYLVTLINTFDYIQSPLYLHCVTASIKSLLNVQILYALGVGLINSLLGSTWSPIHEVVRRSNQSGLNSSRPWSARGFCARNHVTFVETAHVHLPDSLCNAVDLVVVYCTVAATSVRAGFNSSSVHF